MGILSKNLWLFLSLLALAALISGCTKCVKFDSIPPETRWGAPAGHSSGDVVYNEDNIEVSVHDFYLSATSTNFGETRLGTSFTGSGGQALFTRDINLEFDFSNLSFTPNKVELVFRDTGGIENISVNGSPIIRGALVSGSAAGLTWTVTDTPEPANPVNRLGTLIINGNIETLKIGGQEFWIDSVCAQKE